MKSEIETKKIDHKQSNSEKMKTLRKLEINPERLMKDEELTLLRGGYGGAKCYDACSADSDCIMWECPKCVYPMGNPDQKFCFSP